MPRFVPLPAPLDDPLLDLRALLQAAHARLQRLEPTLGRVVVLTPGPRGEGLGVYLACDPGQSGEAGAESLPDIAVADLHESLVLEGPGGRELQSRWRARVDDDLAAAVASAHQRWLLSRGWRSTLTLPLRRRGSVLGLVQVTAGRPAAFRPEALEHLLPLLDRLLLRIADHLGAIADLHANLALMAEMVTLRDPPTGFHLERVSRYCVVIARALERELPLPAAFAERIARYAPLHDVGKVGIPDRILLKPAMLDPEEQALMRSHVAIGVALIERLLEALHLSRDPGVQMLRQVVAHHHEYLDGSGYPQGLSGAEVSLTGRIVAVADIYDSLTQERPYKRPIPDARAGEILCAMVESGKLDRRCVEALLAHEEQRGRIRDLELNTIR